MQPREWTICIIEPNKLDAQIMADMLRNAGVERIKTFSDSAAALEAMEFFAPHVIIAAYDAAPLGGVAWTKAFRRTHVAMNRKAPIFVTARALSKAVAEDCRHGGANAVIVKPLSSQSLIGTIKKVLSAPREFIDAAGYVGPCRRAGIVMADSPPKRRRGSDQPKDTLSAAHDLKRAVEDYVARKTDVRPSVTALKVLCSSEQDAAMARACAAFGALLSANTQAARDVLIACLAGILALADPAQTDAQKRDAIAERVHQAAAKATLQSAA